MKLLFLTPGTGSYHCGVCMRDNALARELIRTGHDAILLPLYLPLALDEDAATSNAPVFFGGANSYLSQLLPAWSRAPRWLAGLLDHPRLLRQLGRFSGRTGGEDVGALTHSMLLGEDGRQAGELERLIAWCRAEGKPDAIWLSTALLAGLARRLGAALGVPVLGSLQGEDSFLDGLGSPWSARCWATLSERARDAVAWVAPSQFYADFMARRMQLAPEKIRVIPNGIALADYAPAPAAPATPTIGYLARFSASKGLDRIVDAFVLAKKQRPDLRLRCAGTMTGDDARFVEIQRRKLADAGCSADAEFLPNVTREEKSAFLRSLSLLSVAPRYEEAFGLYLPEAWASGVPTVLPPTGAFPELIALSRAGTLAASSEPAALADAWLAALAAPEELAAARERARRAAETDFSLEKMARRFLELTA